MSKLWSIYIPGPDEYHPAPSEAAAKHMAEKHNAAMAEWYSKNIGVHGPSKESTTASVAEWPFEAEDHAEDIKDFDYASWGMEGGEA